LALVKFLVLKKMSIEISFAFQNIIYKRIRLARLRGPQRPAKLGY